MANGLEQQKKAVTSGHWPLYRYNPELEEAGKNPLIIDSKEPTMNYSDYILSENRYKMLKRINPTEADELIALAEKDAMRAWKFLKGRRDALEPETDGE